MSIRDTLERVRVSADFTDADGRRLAGSYSTRIDSRLTSAEGDDTIIPAGIVPSACGHLSTDDRRRSLDIRVPATDDPEIREDGWRVIITVVFCERRGSETYVLEDIPAGSEINLADVVPIVFPEGGQVPTSPVIIHGEDGVGIEDITYDAEARALVFHLTDGTTTDVELPGASQPGEPGGRGIESITAEGTTATVTYTDGDTDTFELPRGLQGEPGRDGVDGVDGEPGRDGADGRGVESITAEDTTATVSYTDGGTGTFELPRGLQGEPGRDGADGAPGSDGAPGDPGRDGVDGRGVESITAEDTTATVAYTDGGTGTFELPRGPQGDPGSDGVDGVDGAPGRGVESITAEDATATVSYTDGGSDTFELPRGPQGDPGRDGVDGAPGEPGRDGSDGAPGSDGVDGRGIAGITSADTTATVAYTDGGTDTFELPRGLPGEKGDPGEPGADGTDVAYSSGGFPTVTADVSDVFAGTTGRWYKWGRMVMLVINPTATHGPYVGSLWSGADFPAALRPAWGINVSERLRKNQDYHNVTVEVGSTGVKLNTEGGPVPLYPTHTIVVTYISAS